MKVGASTSPLLSVPLERVKADKATKTTGTGEAKPVPPGLERAQARLQNLSSPSAGQATALDRISRNIARYTQNQAMAEPSTVAVDAQVSTEAVTSTSVPAIALPAVTKDVSTAAPETSAQPATDVTELLPDESQESDAPVA